MLQEKFNFIRNKRNYKKSDAQIGDYVVSYFRGSNRYYVGDSSKNVIMRQVEEKEVINFLMDIQPEYFL